MIAQVRFIWPQMIWTWNTKALPHYQKRWKVEEFLRSQEQHGIRKGTGQNSKNAAGHFTA